VRSIELDLHIGKGVESPDGERGDWFDYHTLGLLGLGEDTGARCERLSDCLTLLRGYHLANPEHEVITVWLDLKDGWDAASGHGPADLDRALERGLDPAWLLRPSALLERCRGASGLQDAVTDLADPSRGLRADGCRWPAVRGPASEARGKLLFVLTGDREELRRYVASRGPGDLRGVRRGGRPLAAFVAPEVSTAAEVRALVGEGEPYVFFNLNGGDELESWSSAAAEVKRHGLVSRAFGLDDPDKWQRALALVNHLATDALGSEWARAHSSRGYPFRCQEPRRCDPELEGWSEPGAVLTTVVRAGGASDALHLHARRLESGGHRWQAAIGAAGGDAAGRACLMARAGEGSDAAFFALCRNARSSPLEVLVRPRPGAPVEVTRAAAAPRWLDAWGEPHAALWESELTFLGLHVVRERGTTTLRAEASPTGEAGSWRSLAKRRLAGALSLQGIAVSAGGGLARFLWENLELDGVRVSTAGLSLHLAVHPPGSAPTSSPAPGRGIHDGVVGW